MVRKAIEKIRILLTLEILSIVSRLTTIILLIPNPREEKDNPSNSITGEQFTENHHEFDNS